MNRITISIIILAFYTMHALASGQTLDRTVLLQQTPHAKVGQAMDTVRQDVELLEACLKNPSLDVHVQSVEALKSFGPSARKAVLLTILGNKSFWLNALPDSLPGGEMLTIQLIFEQNVRSCLKALLGASVADALDLQKENDRAIAVTDLNAQQ